MGVSVTLCVTRKFWTFCPFTCNLIAIKLSGIKSSLWNYRETIQALSIVHKTELVLNQARLVWTIKLLKSSVSDTHAQVRPPKTRRDEYLLPIRKYLPLYFGNIYQLQLMQKKIHYVIFAWKKYCRGTLIIPTVSIIWSLLLQYKFEPWLYHSVLHLFLLSFVPYNFRPFVKIYKYSSIINLDI